MQVGNCLKLKFLKIHIHKNKIICNLQFCLSLNKKKINEYAINNEYLMNMGASVLFNK